MNRIHQIIAEVNWQVWGTKLLGGISLFTLAGMLAAGLWPFHSPKNHVTWSAGGNGVEFGRDGTILSSGEFRPANTQDNVPCTIEVRLEPHFTAGSSTILALYARGSPRQFSLHQSDYDLAVQTDERIGRFRTHTTRFYVPDIFRKGKPLFITITSAGGLVSVYIDGALARTASNLPLSGRTFDGELVIANSPIVDDSWSGRFRGLAFYDQALSPAQVVHHFETWTEKGRPDISEDEHAVGLYLFDERAGSVIHNRASSGPDLYIPQRFMVFDEVFLQPFWEEYYSEWDYWKAVLINVGGFIPLGFLFCAYFSLAGRIKRPALTTVLLGFLVSLTIETLQAFLPTRDSGTTDLITNTLGTYLGAGLYSASSGFLAGIRVHLVGIAEKGKRASRPI